MDPIAIITGLISALGGFLGLFGRLCACILPVVFLVGFGIFMYRRSQQGKAAQTWPSTMGTVLSSNVQFRRSGNSTSVYPVVIYQYQVSGQTYQGQTLKAGEQFFSVRIMGDAHATVARYPIGAQVMVYYNPANPKESALER